jgi:hypothetical protein
MGIEPNSITFMMPTPVVGCLSSASSIGVPVGAFFTQTTRTGNRVDQTLTAACNRVLCGDAQAASSSSYAATPACTITK